MNNISQEERILNTELKKLISNANSRIKRIEKETKIKEGFGIKHLIDHLSSQPIKAITKSGYISMKRDYTLMQKKAIIKAIKDFKESGTGSVREIKKYVQKYSQIVGKKLTYKQANVVHQVLSNLSWLFDENLTPSIFYRTYYPMVKTMEREDWIDSIIAHKKDISDRNLRRNLEILYNDIKNETIKKLEITSFVKYYFVC